MLHQCRRVFSVLCVLTLCFGMSYEVFAQTQIEAQSGLDATRDPHQESRPVEEYLDYFERERYRHNKVTTKSDVAQEAPATIFDKDFTVYIRRIEIRGVSELSNKEMTQVTQPYVGKKLSMNDINTIVNALNKLYVEKGFILSRATVPPQKIENDTLVFEVKEQEIGNITIEGNRHYTDRQIKRRLGLSRNDIPNIEYINNQLNVYNQHSDLNLELTLQKGQEEGKTDVFVKVDERLPIHAELSWDNFGSRFIGEDRYRVTLKHNNVTKNDDVLSLTFLRSDGDDVEFGGASYVFPLTNRWKVGASAYAGRSNLGEELAVLEPEGRTRSFGAFSSYDVIQTPRQTLTLKGGFDYNNISNEYFSSSFSGALLKTEDRLRMAYIDMVLDRHDRWGRSFIYNSTTRGIPNIGGGLSDAYDPNISSRFGSSGEFTKNNLNILRINRLPLEAQLRLKGEAQWTNDVLPSSELISVGGPYNVRGYPNGEITGDEGHTASVELSIPFYLLPSKSTVPFTKERWYDAFRLVGFFDYGDVEQNNHVPGVDQNEDLKSAGLGARLSFSNDFSVRVDWAQGLDGIASDGSKHQTWIQVRKGF